MTISQSPDLYYAILAMDAYNRGYKRGLVVPGNKIGNADLVADSSLLGSVPNNSNLNKDNAASFFAQAYTFNQDAGTLSGKTVISYRGTDDKAFFRSTSDAWNGWITALGAYSSLAVQATIL